MVASEVKQIGETVDTDVGPSPLKKIYLATLGAGVVMREEGGKLFEHLVERGTPLEEPVRQHVANAREQIDRDVTRAGQAINRAVGRVLRALDEMKLSSNTLVVFTSDNGQMPGASVADPLRAAKGYLYEGGIRVPLMIRHPVMAKSLRSPDNRGNNRRTISTMNGARARSPTCSSSYSRTRTRSTTTAMPSTPRI